jgi:hypothetical protein
MDGNILDSRQTSPSFLEVLKAAAPSNGQSTMYLNTSSNLPPASPVQLSRPVVLVEPTVDRALEQDSAPPAAMATVADAIPPPPLSAPVIATVAEAAAVITEILSESALLHKVNSPPVLPAAVVTTTTINVTAGSTSELHPSLAVNPPAVLSAPIKVFIV